MEEETNDNEYEREPENKPINVPLVIMAGLALSVCLYFLGSEYQKMNTIELLSKIYLEERCPNTIDYTVMCIVPGVGYTDVIGQQQYKETILDKELTKHCSKGYVVCQSK